MTIVRTETRLVRPFVGLSQCEDLIEKTILKQGLTEFSFGPVVLPSHKIKEGHFVLHTNTNIDELVAACKEARVPSDSVKYVVFANSRTLRKSTLIFEQTLDADRKFPTQIEIEEPEDDDFSRYVFKDSAGFTVTVALVVAEDLPAKALVAHLPGTFLARGNYSIKPEEDFSNFSPEALTDILRVQFGIPKSSMTYTNIGEGLLQAEDLSEVVTVYLDSDVLNLLLQDESDEASKLIQTNLAIQTVETLTRAIKQEMLADGLSVEELNPEGGCFFFLSKLSDDLKLGAQEILDMVIDDYPRFHSFMEGRFNSQKITEDLLKGSQ